MSRPGKRRVGLYVIVTLILLIVFAGTIREVYIMRLIEYIADEVRHD